MVIETSAIVTIRLQEPGARRFAEAIRDAEVRLVSAVSVVEAGLVVLARSGPKALDDLDELLRETGAEVVAFDGEQAALALAAARQFGKGRHPAALNSGDCCSYALAKQRDEALLFNGNDFTQTDARPALSEASSTQGDEDLTAAADD